MIETCLYIGTMPTAWSLFLFVFGLAYRPEPGC